MGSVNICILDPHIFTTYNADADPGRVELHLDPDPDQKVKN